MEMFGKLKAPNRYLSISALKVITLNAWCLSDGPMLNAG